MRILFLGSGSFAVPTLRRLHQSRHEIVKVITQPARASGRGLKPTPTPVAQAAAELSLECLEVADVNRSECVRWVAELRPDVALVIAFGQKIGPELRKTPPHEFLNLHASLLPKYRGAAPINWAIINGEKTTGCTVFRIVERMDAGPILTMSETPIKADETAGELQDRLAEIGVQTVESALQMFDADRPPDMIAQDETHATKAPKLQKAHGFLDFTQRSTELLNRIRGVTPWPGAQATLVQKSLSEQVQILRAVELSAKENHQTSPGALSPDGYVTTGVGCIQIIEIKPAGKRAMKWSEFCNGRKIVAGDHFINPAFPASS